MADGRRAAGAGGALAGRRLTPVLVLLLALPLLPASRLHAEPLNRVVLRVNDQIATLYDYQQRRDDVEREVRHRVQDPAERQKELASVPETVFRDMFQELLLSSRADQLAVEASDKEIDESISEMKEHFGFKTDEELNRALQQNGLTMEALRAQTRRNIRIHDVIVKEVQAKVKVKDEDLRRYYRKHQAEFEVPEQVQLREVVVLDDGGLADPQRSKVASQIRQSVAAGKSLSDAVAPFADKGQASHVIELGWVSAKDLEPTLQAAAWKLSKDAVSDPIPARGGIHVVQLIDRHPAHVKAFSEVQAQIQKSEENRLYQDESTKYIAELETKSLVVADPPQEAANFRRKIGVQEGQPIQGITSGGSSPGASQGAPTPANSAAAPAVKPDEAPAMTGSHAPTVDTSNQRSGGVPPATPAGSSPEDKIKIPPPAPPADGSPASPTAPAAPPMMPPGENPPPPPPPPPAS